MVQPSALAVVSWPAPMKVMMLSAISAARQPVRPFGAQQQRQEILRRAVGIVRRCAALRMAIVSATMLAEEGHGLAAAQSRDARQPVGRAQQVERIDAAHRLEQPVDLALELAGLAGDLAGKQRLGEDLVGERGHVARDVDGAAEHVVVACRELLGALQHRAGKAEDVARREDRRHRLARAPPHRAFGRQQPVAQDRAQDLLAHRRKLVVPGVVDQDMADQARIVGDDQRAAGPRHRNPRLVVGRLAP